MSINDKSALRKHFKAVRNNMDSTSREECDRLINNALLSCDEYKSCNDILVYVSSDIEVSTQKIIAQSFGKKRVLCPRCASGTNEMFFYEIESLYDLESGYFGILEPRQSCARVTDFHKALCIVPALSYDLKGYRLGFGKGFYDRFLCNFKGDKIGLCYENCLSQTLPSDIYDINVDKIVTENRILVARKDDKINGR